MHFRGLALPTKCLGSPKAVSVGRLAGNRDGESDCHVKEPSWSDLVSNRWPKKILRGKSHNWDYR